MCACARAATIDKALVDQNDVVVDILSIQSYGSTRLAVSNTNTASPILQTRIQIIDVLQNKKERVCERKEKAFLDAAWITAVPTLQSCSLSE